MKGKIQFQQSSIYTSSKSQIQRGDVRDFLAKYDPVRLPNRRVEKLFGSVIIRFDGAVEGEVFSHPHLRPLLRRLHAIWPWSAFFINLHQPLGPACGRNQLPLQALGLCITDLKLGIWQESHLAHLEVGAQFRHFCDHCHEVIDRLGKRTLLSPEMLQSRHKAVCRQFNPLLTTGRSAEPR